MVTAIIALDFKKKKKYKWGLFLKNKTV